jgi:N6-adenosine-specific RNA methylase IME4
MTEINKSCPFCGTPTIYARGSDRTEVEEVGGDNILRSLSGLRFDLIVSDPPWPMRKTGKRISRPNQDTCLDYPTMSLSEIRDMDVAGCADDNSVLFLWATHSFLRSAFDVMDSYGFRYQRTLTWDKGNGICLCGFHHRTEFCLFGYRGKIEVFPRRKTIPTVFSGKSERHSAKPDEFYKMVEPLGSNRLDIFARKHRKGWTVWGNEVTQNEVRGRQIELPSSR